MNKKMMISLLTTLTLISFTGVAAQETSKQGWVKENGFWYFYQNQKPVMKQWQGNYYLKADGKMAEKEWIYDPDYQGWYYLKSDGTYAYSTWQGNFYLNPNGKMALAEWVYDESYKAWYYLKGNGIYARSEWQKDYYLKADGKMANSEWVQSTFENAWYYLKADGSYARNEWEGSYYLKSNGKMANSEWIFDQTYQAWYYLKGNGAYAHDEEIDGYYLESNGKMRESEEAHLRRELDNSVQSQRKQYEKKALEKAIQWLESEDSITINDDFAKRLYQYGSTEQGKHQENISALNILSKELLKANQKEIGAISNTLLAKYNLRTMPEDMKQSLSLYAASLINSVRQQMKLSPVKVTDTMVTIAEKIAKEYIHDGRFIADGKGHDAYAINKVVEQYGILTSQDQSKENGKQYFENAISTDFQNKDYFTIRAELREAILIFLFNGMEYDHAQSIAGVNFGNTYQNQYFAVGLGASGHFIQVEDSYIEKQGSLPFSKVEISQKVRTDYEQKVIQRLKEQLASLQ